MRAWELSGGFGLDRLKLVERAADAPGPRDVVVELRAWSLNHRDLLIIEGRYNPRQQLPLIPLSDGVGEVVAVGDSVTRCTLGDRVATLFAPKWQRGEPDENALRSALGGPNDGVLRERITLSEDGVVKLPAYLSDVEGATLPCAALTAWSALMSHGPVTPTDIVLVEGTGGVSIFALQIARKMGARVIATSSSDEKLERVREMGAFGTINYVTESDWGKEARAIAGGRGVDFIVEVGGAKTLKQSLRAVRPGGTIALIGILGGGGEQPVNLTPVLMNNIRVQGIFVGHREAFEHMLTAFEQDQIRPVVDRVFAFEEAKEALAYLDSGQHFGKVCLSLSVPSWRG